MQVVKNGKWKTINKEREKMLVLIMNEVETNSIYKNYTRCNLNSSLSISLSLSLYIYIYRVRFKLYLV